MLLAAWVSPARADEADEMLARIDRYRLQRGDVMVEVELKELDLTTPVVKKEHRYRVYLNARSDSMVEMLSPEERGRRVLMTDDAVWLHIPSASRPIRITPLQRLLGQANYGDIARLAWSGAYRIRGAVDEPGLTPPALGAAEPFAGARFPGVTQTALRRLTLEAAGATATYPRIEVWVRAEDLAPIRADYFLTSGKRLKTGWFSAPQATRAGRTIRSIAFVDDKSPTTATLLTTTSTQPRVLAPAFFTVRGFTRSPIR